MKKALTYWFSFLLVLLIATSCSVFKKDSLFKDKSNIKTKETFESKTNRPGDTLSYTLPNVTYKDTTIWVKNFANPNGNTIKVVYDKDGNTKVDCISESINEFIKYQLQRDENRDKKEKTAEKTKEFQFKDIYFLYVFLMIIGFKLLQKYKII